GEDFRRAARRGCARCARGGSLSGQAELRSVMLSLVDVSAGYGSFHALFGVSLEVAAGETVGVIGPNGAGKTTLMRVISGLVTAFGGGITLEGRSILGIPAYRIVEEVFDLIRRIRAEGLTVLIVEQNIQQVLEVVDRAYLLELGAIRLAGSSSELKNNEFLRKAYMGL